MIRYFDRPWHEVPLVVVDTETTGTGPGDRAVQFGAVWFVCGEIADEFKSLVDPGISIPAEATAIHGITDEMVRGMPTIEAATSRLVHGSMLDESQLAAYNADFDRGMLPRIGDGHWPWLDPLVLVRHVDRYAKGKGRHTLATSCERHGIEMVGAHGALADARAAGKLLYKLGRDVWRDDTLGRVLRWTREMQAKQWYDYHEWLSKQPTKEQSCQKT